MTFKGALHEFQKPAYSRALRRQQVLIAYEMGLGKTIIVIAIVERLIDTGRVSGGLVIAPAGIKYQWAEKIEEFTDGALVQVIDGTPAERDRQWQRVRRGEMEYTICNPEQIVNDWNLVRHLDFDFIVLDEATSIKGFRAKRTKRIKRLTAPYKLALTGQPIENRPEELFSILQWVDPDVLGRAEVFDKHFLVRNHWGKVTRIRNIPTLHRLLSDVMVRKTRLDPDVKDQMPDVVEMSVPVVFDPAGRKLYRIIAEDLIESIQEALGQGGGFDLWRHYSGRDNNAAQGDVMSKLTALRMLCDHPDLLRLSADAFDDPDSVKGSLYASELREAGKLTGLRKAPKYDATLKLMDQILSESPRNKIVIFSFFKPTLSMLQESLTKRRVGSVLFTGDMNAREKGEAQKKFKRDPKCRVFLSSDAGNYGVDLPQANYLISYDLPWSAGKWDQRNSRIIRLSSEWDSVTLVSMVMRGSIEERMLAMLEEKAAVASAILDGKGVDQKGQFKLGLGTLLDFVQSSRV